MSAKIKMKLIATFDQNCPGGPLFSWKFRYKIGLAWPFSPSVVNQPSERKQLTNSTASFSVTPTGKIGSVFEINPINQITN